MPGDNEDINKTIDHLFRHEAGKMVAVLTRLLGFYNIEVAKDIVQDTILAALETWKYKAMPANPQAWLYFTAKNKVIDVIRRKKVKYKAQNEISFLLRSETTLLPALDEMFSENEIKDSQLRMMFACCNPALSKQVQISFMLNTLCGLSVKEIADAFLSNEDTIQKRLYRTKEKLRTENIALNHPGIDEMDERIDAVLKTLYLLFNEGYNSSHPKKLIREDLCEEAMRLTILLTENAKTNLPGVNALLALMCFQASRFNARIDEKGNIILLKDQDRKQWNKFLIKKGNEYLNRSAAGNALHEFHIEAGIASIHANAASYEDTDWKMILQLYNALLNITANPVVALNRCLVIGELEGFDKAINELKKLTALEENCYYNSSLGELYLKSGNKEEARKKFGKALSLTSSNAERELIHHKINMCD